MAAADEHQLVVGAGRGLGVVEPAAQPLEVVDQQRRHDVDALVGGLQPRRHRGGERPEVDTLGVLDQVGGRRAATGVEQQLDEVGGGRGELGGGVVAERLTQTVCDPRREAAEDLPVVALVVAAGEDRGRPPGGVAHREAVEDQVVLVALERARRR
ncbi:MAG: hypothetical protein JWN84_1419 [Nocardioides sp.]|nr:hypothetical protein [Nocardioides sp.]